MLYNPEEYTVSKDNNFAVQGVPGLGSPIVQFVNGNQRTLEVELFFDTWDTTDAGEGGRARADAAGRAT